LTRAGLPSSTFRLVLSARCPLSSRTDGRCVGVKGARPLRLSAHGGRARSCAGSAAPPFMRAGNVGPLPTGGTTPPPVTALCGLSYTRTRVLPPRTTSPGKEKPRLRIGARAKEAVLGQPHRRHKFGRTL
jgi:hypothetical protein